MNQEKIGKFILQLRTEKKMTQQELAQKIGVTDRAISNWENGRRLPDYSVIKDLCVNLDITINELFSCEKIKDEEYKMKADKNLFNALENNTFMINDKIKYYKKQWIKTHIFNIILGIIIWISTMLILSLKLREDVYVVGYISGILVSLIYILLHNKMMIYIEKNINNKKNR